MKIDLKAKKTESEWYKLFEKFYLKATPKWFEWLGWVLILGVFRYALEEHDSFALKVIYTISLALLFQYFVHFIDIEIEGLPFVKNKYLKITISLVISFALTFGTLLLISSVIKDITAKV